MTRAAPQTQAAATRLAAQRRRTEAHPISITYTNAPIFRLDG